MKVLIAGAGGQLGQALRRAPPPGSQTVALGRAELDITQPEAITQSLRLIQPTVVINASAYTAVDRAESDSQAAYATNADAVGTLAAACAAHGIRFVHVSTDFVFDGSSGRPYRPDDVTAPLGVYGASKLAG